MSAGIVIGASGGIGGACARSLASAADAICLVGRDGDRLAATAAYVGPGATIVQGDIVEAGTRAAVAAFADERGPLAWLVLASGIPLARPFPEQTVELIERTFATNLVAPALLLHGLLDREWEDGAAIVVVGSISASRALPSRATYGASKAGLEHLARTLAAELADRGLRVNVVAPGVVDTPFLPEDRSQLADWLEDRVPARRAGTAEEVAELVRYVVLDAPAYLTGARIAVDGGAEVVG